MAKQLGLPLIVKPAHEGSTIGITKVIAPRGSASRLRARGAATTDLVLAEEFIAGQELTGAFLGEQALPLIRIEAPQGNYDYQNKYFTDDTKYICPCGLPAEGGARDPGARAALGSGARLQRLGTCRPDPSRATAAVSLLEMNTSPGMTGHSLVPMAAKAAGISFDDLVVRILELAHVG